VIFRRVIIRYGTIRASWEWIFVCTAVYLYEVNSSKLLKVPPYHAQT